MNSLVIKIPRGNAAPKKGTEGILEVIEIAFESFERDAVKFAVYMGEKLIKLKTEAKKEGRRWSELCERLPFSQEHASRFMKIASNEALNHRSGPRQNLTHASNLPADQTILYTLARVPAPQLEQYIEAGEITSKITRSEASELAREAKPTKGTRDKPANVEPLKPHDEHFDSLMKAWDRSHEFRTKWRKAPQSVRERFRREVLK